MIATVTLNPSLDEWVDLPTLRLGELNRSSGFIRYPGGKGINVSRVVRELGGRTHAVALAGGEDGAILRTALQRLSIPHEFVTISGSTRNNYKIRTERPRALTEINTAGPRVSSTAVRRLEHRLLTRRPRPRCVVLSGSLPPGASPSLYARWIRALRREGIPTVLDASGEPLRQGVRARPWLVKPNRQEAEELLRTRLTHLRHAVAAVQALLRLGPAIVILSMGRDGALMGCRSPSGIWLAHPPVVRVSSAVGAGDSLVGGFLVGWLRGAGFLEALRLGVACGAASAMTPGTELCHRADVRRVLPRVTIRRVT